MLNQPLLTCAITTALNDIQNILESLKIKIKKDGKDTGYKCQSSQGGDGHSYTVHCGWRPHWRDMMWDVGLEDYVQDTREEEEQSSKIMNFHHCCLLRLKKKKRNRAIKRNHVTTISNMLHVETNLKCCNNTHAQAGEHPKPHSDFIDTRPCQRWVLTQLLHKLVSGINGGDSCWHKNKQNKQTPDIFTSLL